MNPKRSNSALTILHLGKHYWPHPGGMETAIRQISEYGACLGHEVTCWVAQNRHEPSKLERISGVQVRRFKSFGSLLSVPLSFGIFTAKNPNPEILHLHLPHPFAEVCTLLRRFRGARLIPYFHAFPVGQGMLGRIWFRWITRPILKKAKTILVSTPEMKILVPELQAFSEKLVVLPFAVKCASLDEVEAMRESREAKKLVLTVGRLVPYKGHQILLRAWKNILESHPQLGDWKLVCVGEGPEGEALRSWSSENLKRGSVSFTGALPDPARNELLKDASLYVMSSVTTAETFGISLLEAFAVGLPAVVSDLPGGVSVLSRKGECGRVYSPSSVEALERALADLMTSVELRTKAGKANLTFARNHFSEEHAQAQYSEVIRDR